MAPVFYTGLDVVHFMLEFLIQWLPYYDNLETITIPHGDDVAHCDVTLQPGQIYVVVGYDGKYEFVRKYWDLTNEEKQWLINLARRL
ncbi:hypothetical protein Aduo_018303 [Ancylostoma duodenale]